MGKQPCWSTLPESFLTRLAKIVPSDQLDAVLQSFCSKKPTTFRANTLKISADELAAELTKAGIAHERVPWYREAFILTMCHPGKAAAASRTCLPASPELQRGEPARQVGTKLLADSGQAGMTKDVWFEENRNVLMETGLYKNGFLYVQSLSSMIPPIILDPKPGEKILDIAAAPGSKTTQMAMMMENRGEILANDKSRVRLYKLKANLALQGVSNTAVTHLAGQILWQQYPNYFDRALVDVPCSMEGRFFTEDPKSYQDWSTKKIKSLVQTQRFLLRSAVSATKPGGLIVYSTCTLAPEENEGVIDWILKKEGKRLDILPVSHQFPDAVQGVTRWNEKIYHPDIAKTLRILPSEMMDGFYVSFLQKRHLA